MNQRLKMYEHGGRDVKISKTKTLMKKEMTPSVQSQPHQRSQSMKEQDYSMTTIKVQDKDKERPNHVGRSTVIFE